MQSSLAAAVAPPRAAPDCRFRQAVAARFCRSRAKARGHFRIELGRQVLVKLLEAAVIRDHEDLREAPGDDPQLQQLTPQLL